MRCIGTLEFIDDFHQHCHKTQQQLIESKQLERCPKIEETSSPALEDEVESDKENASPNIQTGSKRKRQITNVERTKASKPMTPARRKANIQVENSNKKRTDDTDEKKYAEAPDAIVKSNSAVIIKSKCDSSTKIEQARENENERSTTHDVDTLEQKSRRRLPTKKCQNEPKNPSDTPKSRPVPVIVKLEKPETIETATATQLKIKNDPKTNKLVWMPITGLFPEADRPKSTRMDKSHDQCPTAGDEAEKTIEKTPESSSTNQMTDRSTPVENVRKTVIRKTPRAPKTIKKTEETPKKETRLSVSGAKNRKKYTDEETADDDNDDVYNRESPKKLGKISDLISDEQKEAIEKFYTVDMSVVDEEVVGEKIVFLEKKMYGCKICEASYPRQDKCQVHIWGHLEMKPYKCNACDFSTVTVSNIRCHIRKSHLKIKPYGCEICEKRYVTAFLLEEHMNIHTGSRPYSCTVCEFSSASRQVLSYHIATHKPSKDVKCDVCSKAFFSKARLRAHMVIHNKDKAANMCKLCSIYLCNNEALQRHYTNVHSQDYICNICGKSCKSRKALNNHQNVHSAAKYKCNVCSNLYKSSHILKEHLLKHEGIRKYKCGICKKDFAQQSHLAAHMAVHSERRFFCPGCKRAFNRHDNMKIHTKRCEAFLANPELGRLLKIRRNRSNPAEMLFKTLDIKPATPKSDENTNAIVQQSVKPSTDGLFLKAELVNVDANLNVTTS